MGTANRNQIVVDRLLSFSDILQSIIITLITTEICQPPELFRHDLYRIFCLRKEFRFQIRVAIMLRVFIGHHQARRKIPTVLEIMTAIKDPANHSSIKKVLQALPEYNPLVTQDILENIKPTSQAYTIIQMRIKNFWLKNLLFANDDKEIYKSFSEDLVQYFTANVEKYRMAKMISVNLRVFTNFYANVIGSIRDKYLQAARLL